MRAYDLGQDTHSVGLKNMVNGCVRRGTNHATFEDVFSATRVFFISSVLKFEKSSRSVAGVAGPCTDNEMKLVDCGGVSLSLSSFLVFVLA